jgi:hypothetical protein
MMSKLRYWLDCFMFFSYSHSFSFMDILVFAFIIPELCNTYSWWFILLVLPWSFYSNRQAFKYIA